MNAQMITEVKDGIAIFRPMTVKGENKWQM